MKKISIKSIIIDIALIFITAFVLGRLLKYGFYIANISLSEAKKLTLELVLTDISVLGVLYFRVFKSKTLTLKDLGFNRFARNISLGLLLALPAILIEISGVIAANSLGLDTGQAGFSVLPNAPKIWLFWPFAALLAPFTEEVFSRGVILLGLKKQGKTELGLFLSALIFAALHGSVGLFLAFFILGIYLGLVVLRAKSIVPTIVIHSIINTFALLGVLYR